MANTVKVITEYCPDIIRQYLKYDTDFTNGRHNYLAKCHERIIELEEDGIRKALIALGWTPPKDDNHGNT